VSTTLKKKDQAMLSRKQAVREGGGNVAAVHAHDGGTQCCLPCAFNCDPAPCPVKPALVRVTAQALYARATAPVKNVALMCFMAWMSGNGIQIFSIIMTFSLLAQPLSAILGSGAGACVLLNA
jgi:hypothetical protein